MYKIKNLFIKLFIISIFSVVPYTGIDASIANDQSTVNFNDEVVDLIAVRVRPDANVKASPVRASVRRDARRDGEQGSYNEQYTEPTDEQYSEPTQQEGTDRGRPGGRR